MRGGPAGPLPAPCRPPARPPAQPPARPPARPRLTAVGLVGAITAVTHEVAQGVAGGRAVVGDPGPAWGPYCSQQRDSRVAWGRDPSNLVILPGGRPGQVEEGKGWVCGWGLPVWPQRGRLPISTGGMWACVGPRAPTWNTPWGRKQEPSREPEALSGGCPKGQASVVAQAPSSSVCPSPRGLGDQKACSFPNNIIPGPPRACLGHTHGLALEPPAIPASGAGPDDSPRSKTRAGRRWLGRGMVRPEGAR